MADFNRIVSMGLALATAIGIAGCRARKIKAECLKAPVDVAKSKPAFATKRPDYDPRTDVVVRSLGGGGLYLEWQGDAILISPYFSRHPSANKKAKADSKAVNRGLANFERDGIQVVTAGDSSYQRISDLYEVTRLLPNADIFLNQSGKRALAPYIEELEARDGNKKTRIKEINGEDSPRLDKRSVWVRGREGNPTTLRLRALTLPSRAAEEGYDEFEAKWSEYRLFEFIEGKAHGFEIELYADDRTTLKYRILVLDSGAEVDLSKKTPAWTEAEPSSDAGDGEGLGDADDLLNEDVDEGEDEDEADAEPAAPAGHGPRYDLVVVSMARHLDEEISVQDVINKTKAGHVMIIDYEDLADDGMKKGLRLAKGVKSEDAGEFICSTQSAVAAYPSKLQPRKPGLGLSGQGWTMPVPGQWIVFPTVPPTRPAPRPKPAPKPSKETEDDEDVVIMD